MDSGFRGGLDYRTGCDTFAGQNMRLLFDLITLGIPKRQISNSASPFFVYVCRRATVRYRESQTLSKPSKLLRTSWFNWPFASLPYRRSLRPLTVAVISANRPAASSSKDCSSVEISPHADSRLGITDDKVCCLEDGRFEVDPKS
jgi:hypothetical protein